MMIFPYIGAYLFLTYNWWHAYSGPSHEKEVPFFTTILGFVLLLIFGSETFTVPPVVLALGVVSAGFHLNKERWNPFHSGYVAGAIALIGVLATVEFMFGGASQWIQQSENATGTAGVSLIAISVGTIATIYTKNPIRYVTVLSGLRNKPADTTTAQDPFQPVEQQATQSQSADDILDGDIDLDDIRLDPEDDPFKDVSDSDATDTKTEDEFGDERPEQQTNNHANEADRTQNMEATGDESHERLKTNDANEADNADSNTTDDQSSTELESLQFPWEDPPETRFVDIGGYTEVKNALHEQIVDPLLSDSGDYERFGVEPSRGILFHGPPGTGKTLFARALANELERPFVELNQADLTHEHINKSPQIISRLFDEAQELNGIVFIDEAEQLLSDRNDTSTSHAEDQKVTNTFLSALTQDDQDFIVLLTTNQRDNMDDAILRPGRVDEEFEIGLPGLKARAEIVKVKLAEVPHDLDQRSVEIIAEDTKGWSGADLHSLINQAKLEAAKRGAEYLEWEDIQAGYEEAKTGVGA